MSGRGGQAKENAAMVTISIAYDSLFLESRNNVKEAFQAGMEPPSFMYAYYDQICSKLKTKDFKLIFGTQSILSFGKGEQEKKRKENGSEDLYQLKRESWQRLEALSQKVHNLRPIFVLGTGCPAGSEHIS